MVQKTSEEQTLSIVFGMVIAAAVAVPLTVMAWAMKQTHCPECGAAVGPDAEIMRVLGG